MNITHSHTGLPIHGTKFTIIERPATGTWAIVGRRLPADAIRDVPRARIIAMLPIATAAGLAVFVRIGGEFHRVSLSA